MVEATPPSMAETASTATNGTVTAETVESTPEESKEKGPEVIKIPSKPAEEVENPLDAERQEHLRKCKVFTDWCATNGIEYPNQEYPAYFDGGLVGVRALAPIEHRQAFLKVPFKCMMSIDKARSHPVLGPVIKENP